VADGAAITCMVVLCIRNVNNTPNIQTNDTIAALPTIILRSTFYDYVKDGVPPSLLERLDLIPLVIIRLVDVKNGTATVLKDASMYFWGKDMPAPSREGPLTQEQHGQIWYWREKVRNMLLQLELEEAHLTFGAFILKDDEIEYNSDVIGRFYRAISFPHIQPGTTVSIVRQSASESAPSS